MGRKREEKKRRKRRRKKEEEKKKKIQVWNSCLEHLFCLELFDLLVRKPPNSFFVYVWVRKTLTLQYMCILVGSSHFCGWF